MPNGSVQQQMMAQYMPQSQSQRPNIPAIFPQSMFFILKIHIFLANQAATPAPIGSRPLNFQATNSLADQLRTNGLERPNINTFSSAESTNAFNRSCTPAELEQIERMRNVRSLWEKDASAVQPDSSTSNVPPNPTVNVAAKFFPSAPTPFGNEFVPKTPGSNVTTQSGNASTDPSAAQNTWGGSYGSIWSFNS
jgi:hypothetical protein